MISIWAIINKIWVNVCTYTSINVCICTHEWMNEWKWYEMIFMRPPAKWMRI